MDVKERGMASQSGKPKQNSLFRASISREALSQRSNGAAGRLRTRKNHILFYLSVCLLIIIIIIITIVIINILIVIILTIYFLIFTLLFLIHFIINITMIIYYLYPYHYHHHNHYHHQHPSYHYYSDHLSLSSLSLSLSLTSSLLRYSIIIFFAFLSGSEGKRNGFNSGETASRQNIMVM